MVRKGTEVETRVIIPVFSLHSFPILLPFSILSPSQIIFPWKECCIQTLAWGFTWVLPAGGHNPELGEYCETTQPQLAATQAPQELLLFFMKLMWGKASLSQDQNSRAHKTSCPAPSLSNPCYSMFLQSYTTRLSNLFLPGLISHSPHCLPKPNSENTLFIKFPSLQGSGVALLVSSADPVFNPSLQPGLLFTAGKFWILHCRKLKQTYREKASQIQEANYHFTGTEPSELQDFVQWAAQDWFSPHACEGDQSWALD